jgi:hypothetical protein
MAEKEATVYIVDVGKSMGEMRNGRSMTDLEWAMQYVWDRITATVATGRKTATIGVIGLKTDGKTPTGHQVSSLFCTNAGEQRPPTNLTTILILNTYRCFPKFSSFLCQISEDWMR